LSAALRQYTEANAPFAEHGAVLLEGLPHAAWLVDLHAGATVAAVNDAAVKLLAQPRAALLGQAARALLDSPEDQAWWAAAGSNLGTQGNPVAALLSDTFVVMGNGSQSSAQSSAQSSVQPPVQLPVTRSIRMLPPHGPHALALVTVADRRNERQTEREREALLAELQATLEATADGILVTDATGRVRAFNRRFAQLWQAPMAVLLQHDDAALQDWMNRSLLQPTTLAALPAAAAEEPVASERMHLANGRVLERVSQPLLQAGRAQGRVWSFRDLTERLAAQDAAQHAQAQLHNMALHDVLTGLPNRRLLGQHIENAAAAQPHRSGAFALLVIDLDRFGQINDSLGQAVGDRVLVDVSSRIQSCLRGDDVLARLGGDQFAVLLRVGDGASAKASMTAAAEASAKRILSVVAQPCELGGACFTLTCSIGLALAPAHGNNLDDLVRHAENAMRAVKAAGRGNFKLHQARNEVDRRGHMQLDHAMRQALVSGRFRLHYQPQVNLQTGQVAGAEALLRWRDPELGDVPPGRFIPVAEESGFIVAMGDWVLSQAVRQAVLWHQRGHSLPMAVNVSALQFQQANFVDRVASILAVSGLPPHLLELELTESILVHDAEEALHRLAALARLGVRLAIDDFGTGYSSLAYLKRFPIDKLKIDRSFVSGLPRDASDAAIVRAILQMARALGMQVIAEGVETESQRQFLQDEGCAEFQGFLYSPALDTLSFEARVFAARGAACLPHAQDSVRPVSQGPAHIRLVRP
jgi:diguanylate cyclase (GGDEF)-like protein